MYRRGSLLIITLWMVIILGALAVSVARYLSSEIRLTKYKLAREQAAALARSGVHLGMHELTLDVQSGGDTYEDYDWLEDDWAIPRRIKLESGELLVTIIDEERKLNINTATVLQLEALLNQTDLAAMVESYRNSTDPPNDDPPFFAKQADIVALEELSEMPGMETQIYEEILRAHTTSYTMSDEPPNIPININTVSSKVMEALGISAGVCDAIEIFREDEGVVSKAEDLVAILDDLGVLEDEERNLLNSMQATSNTFMVVSEAYIAQPGVTVRIEAVVRRDAGGESPKIIAWRQG